jgi:hypothetical protein
VCAHACIYARILFWYHPARSSPANNHTEKERKKRRMWWVSAERARPKTRQTRCDYVTFIYILLSLMPPTWLVIRPRFLVIIPDGKYTYIYINKCPRAMNPESALSGVHNCARLLFSSLSLRRHLGERARVDLIHFQWWEIKKNTPHTRLIIDFHIIMSFSHALNFYAVAFDTWGPDTFYGRPAERVLLFFCYCRWLICFRREWERERVDNPLGR